MSFPLVHTAFDNSNLMDFSINKKLISAAGESVQLVTAVTIQGPTGAGGAGKEGQRELTHSQLVCLGINKMPEKEV